MIPIDGSTIDVYIDGVVVGHPSYGHFRADIAALFPGYANSNGAVGFISSTPPPEQRAPHDLVGRAGQRGRDAGWGVASSACRTRPFFRML